MFRIAIYARRPIPPAVVLRTSNQVLTVYAAFALTEAIGPFPAARTDYRHAFLVSFCLSERGSASHLRQTCVVGCGRSGGVFCDSSLCVHARVRRTPFRVVRI